MIRQPTHFDVIVAENMFSGTCPPTRPPVISGSLRASASVRKWRSSSRNPRRLLSAGCGEEHRQPDGHDPLGTEPARTPGAEGSAVRAAVDRALTEGVQSPKTSPAQANAATQLRGGEDHRRAIFRHAPLRGLLSAEKGLQPQRLRSFPVQATTPGQPRPGRRLYPGHELLECPQVGRRGPETRGRQASRASRGSGGTAGRGLVGGMRRREVKSRFPARYGSAVVRWRCAGGKGIINCGAASSWSRRMIAVAAESSAQGIRLTAASRALHLSALRRPSATGRRRPDGLGRCSAAAQELGATSSQFRSRDESAEGSPSAAGASRRGLP